MTEKEVMDYVKRQMGSSTVDVEIDKKDFEAIMKTALDKLRPFYNGVRYVQASGQIIDVSNHHPIAVSRVWNGGDIQYNTIQDLMFGGVGLMIYDINFMQRFEMMKAYQMLWNEIQNQKGENFRYINNTIYLDGYLDNILIELTVNLQVVSDIDERSEYCSWYKEYVLALAKELVGRKRSKTSLQGSPIQLDGDRLLSEAQAEKSNLESQLIGDIYVY